LEVSPDYLLNGTIQDKAKNNIQDIELLLQFEKVEKLPDNKKHLVKEFLDAFIIKANLQKQLSKNTKTTQIEWFLVLNYI
jgi:hypothetical protein